MVKAGMQLKKLPGEREWTTNLEKVSLMENPLTEDIPPHFSPACPHLSTLLLQGSHGLRSIPNSFHHMPGLNVLDLSGTKITTLPDSIVNLKNLKALILVDCPYLRFMPSLAELRALRKLDLYSTGMKEISHGIDMLENLTCLRLWPIDLKELPIGILLGISHLQCLILGLHLRGEVGRLRKLEILSCFSLDLQEFEIYAKSIQGKWPINFNFQVGSSRSFLSPGVELVQSLKKLQKTVTFVNYKMEKMDHRMVPNGVRTICISRSDDFKCLSHIPLFQKSIELKRCDIKEHGGIECVVDLSLSSCNTLQNIELLHLWGLYNFIELVRTSVGVQSISHAPTPPTIFSSLKEMYLQYCSRIEKLFPIKLLQGLQNLERIEVIWCEEMEGIIPLEEEEEEEEEENQKGKWTTFGLPKLKSLFLFYLPKPKGICSSGVMIHADSLQYLAMVKCPKLKRIPLSLPLLDNGKLSSVPSLTGIELSSCEWWESLEWDHPYAKDVLAPFVSLYY